MSSCIVRRCSCFGSLRQPYSLLIIIFFKVTPARLWVYDSPVKPVGELFGYLLFSSTMWHSFEIHMAAFLPQILVDSVNRTSLPWWAAIMVGLVGWSPSQKFIWWHGELNKSTAPAMEEAWFRCFSIVHHVKLSNQHLCVCDLSNPRNADRQGLHARDGEAEVSKRICGGVRCPGHLSLWPGQVYRRRPWHIKLNMTVSSWSLVIEFEFWRTAVVHVIILLSCVWAGNPANDMDCLQNLVNKNIIRAFVTAVKMILAMWAVCPEIPVVLQLICILVELKC